MSLSSTKYWKEKNDCKNYFFHFKILFFIYLYFILLIAELSFAKMKLFLKSTNNYFKSTIFLCPMIKSFTRNTVFPIKQVFTFEMSRRLYFPKSEQELNLIFSSSLQLLVIFFKLLKRNPFNEEGDLIAQHKLILIVIRIMIINQPNYLIFYRNLIFCF